MIESRQVPDEGAASKSNEDYAEKVLFIIDDDEIMLEMLCSNLQTFGFSENNIHKFSSAVEALEIIRFVKPDLMITDVHMPGLSGDSMAKLLQWPEFNACPIIAMTSDYDFSPQGTAASLIDVVVYKPIESDRLISKIVNTLNLAQRRQRAAENDRHDRAVELSRSIKKKESGLRRAFGKPSQANR